MSRINHAVPPAAGGASPVSREFWWICLLGAVNFAHILDFVIIMPLGDQLREELAITPQQFGWVVSVYGIAAMVAGLLGALVVDRLDRKRTLLWMLAGFVGATFYCGTATSWLALMVARGLAGICGGVVASTVLAFVVELIPEVRRGRALGVITSSFAVASIVGLPLGLTLATRGRHFGAPFFAIAGLGLIVWLACCWGLPRLPGRELPAGSSPAKEFRQVIAQPNHLWAFAFSLAMVFGTFLVVPFLAAYLVANCGVPRVDLPWVYGIAGVATLVGTNLVGWLSDRWGATRMFAAMAGSSLLMTLLITRLPSVSVGTAIAATTVFMVVTSARVVPAQALMLRAADPTTRSAFTSINSAVTHFATATGPLLGGLLIGEEYPQGPLTGFAAAGWAGASCTLVAIGISQVVARRRHGTPPAPSSPCP